LALIQIGEGEKHKTKTHLFYTPLLLEIIICN